MSVLCNVMSAFPLSLTSAIHVFHTAMYFFLCQLVNNATSLLLPLNRRYVSAFSWQIMNSLYSRHLVKAALMYAVSMRSKICKGRGEKRGRDAC